MDKYLSVHSMSWWNTFNVCFRNSSTMFDTHSFRIQCSFLSLSYRSNDQKRNNTYKSALISCFVWPHFKRFRQVPCRTEYNIENVHRFVVFIHRNHFPTSNIVCITLTILFSDKQKHDCTKNPKQTHRMNTQRSAIYITHVINSSTGWQY